MANCFNQNSRSGVPDPQVVTLYHFDGALKALKTLGVTWEIVVTATEWEIWGSFRVGGFLGSWGYTQIIHFRWGFVMIFHDKPTIVGDPPFMNTPKWRCPKS